MIHVSLQLMVNMIMQYVLDVKNGSLHLNNGFTDLGQIGCIKKDCNWLRLFFKKENVCVLNNFRNSLHSTYFRNLTDRNKSFYKQYKRTLCNFRISLQIDPTSSWLFLSSLFYKCKRYQECLYIINCSLYSCTPSKINLHLENSLAEQTTFKEFKQRWGLYTALKHLVIKL